MNVSFPRYQYLGIKKTPTPSVLMLLCSERGDRTLDLSIMSAAL